MSGGTYNGLYVDEMKFFVEGEEVPGMAVSDFEVKPAHPEIEFHRTRTPGPSRILSTLGAAAAMLIVGLGAIQDGPEERDRRLPRAPRPDPPPPSPPPLRAPPGYRTRPEPLTSRPRLPPRIERKAGCRGAFCRTLENCVCTCRQCRTECA